MRFSSTVTVVLALAAASVIAGSGISDLEKQLIDTRKDLKKAQVNAADSNRKLLIFKDRVVYSKKDITEMYLKMKALEKELLVQRQKVDDQIMKLPEYREMIKKRNDAYARVRDLKDKEASILLDLKSARDEDARKNGK